MVAQSTGISRSQCMSALAKAQIPEDADIDTIIDLIYKNISTI